MCPNSSGGKTAHIYIYIGRNKILHVKSQRKSIYIDICILTLFKNLEGREGESFWKADE